MKEIILASGSARRKEILGQFIDFKIIKPDIEEIKNNEVKANTTVMALAFEKGMAVARENEDSLVLSCDTLVEIDGELLGKPKDRDDAREMLKKLSGKAHNVYSGYALILLSEKIKYLDFVKTSVKFKNLTDDDIENYLDTGEYKDKAGSYAIQEKGSLLIEKFDGDYFNVVGLPISKINDDLKRIFNIDLMRC
ncbi:Maf family protein [Peptoniphilus sp.]|jgi:septum formation protein|uniref:Maf family protein n=1 Tax=Peptoniphilus sp. TaxID=1971214 RepID=UPI003D93B108